MKSLLESEDITIESWLSEAEERCLANDVLDAGVSRAAVRDAFYVGYLFNTYDRLADTLGWELPEQSYHAKAGKFLLKKGYA